MANQNRWPKEGGDADELKHKLGESIWWLTILACRMDMDIEEAIQYFLEKTEKHFGIDA
jgi:NTP pyrophosphatase (non-canonical NTP hydrolase)